MDSFKIYTDKTAPADSKEILKDVKEAVGFIPNLYGILAESPTALKAYSMLDNYLGSASFSEQEKQLLCLAVSVENDCPYCQAAHTYAVKMDNVSEDIVESIRTGVGIQDPKTKALVEFTRHMIQTKGFVDSTEVDKFLKAGYSKAALFEVIVLVAMKVISNYTNHMAKTPNDEKWS